MLGCDSVGLFALRVALYLAQATQLECKRRGHPVDVARGKVDLGSVVVFAFPRRRCVCVRVRMFALTYSMDLPLTQVVLCHVFGCLLLFCVRVCLLQPWMLTIRLFVFNKKIWFYL